MLDFTTGCTTCDEYITRRRALIRHKWALDDKTYRNDDDRAALRETTKELAKMSQWHDEHILEEHQATLPF